MLSRLALSTRSKLGLSDEAVNRIKTNYYYFHTVSGGVVGGLGSLMYELHHSNSSNNRFYNTLRLMVFSPFVILGSSFFGAIIGPPGIAACYFLASA